MPYSTQPNKLRNSVLGYNTFNRLVENLESNLAAWRLGHTEAGEHNTVEAPRAVAMAYWDGANYNLRGSSAGVSSLSKTTTGEVTFTLSSTYFPFSNMVARAMPMGSNDAPWIANAKIVSNTSVKVFLSKGTAWTATDGSFAIVLHTDPRVAPPSASWNVISKLSRTPKTGLQFASFNKLTQNGAFLRSNLLTEHTSAGIHNAQHLPRTRWRITWNGASYDIGSNPTAGISSVSSPGTGIAQLNLAASTFPNNPNPSVEIMVMPQTSSTDQWISFAPQANISNTGNFVTSFRVYQWKKSSTNTWTLTDGDFYVSLHCAAV